MWNEFDEFEEKAFTQMDIYSPSPKIKIKKWFEKPCIACNNAIKDYGEYDSVGWFECSESEKLGNLKCFPYCSAKKCNKFNPKISYNHKSDYWLMIGDFDKAFGENGFKKLINLLAFNERMGDYKVGRIA